MQSEKTSKKQRKIVPETALAVGETAKAEPVKTVRATKSSPTKAVAAKKTSGTGPKHHHSTTSEKFSSALVSKATPAVEIVVASIEPKEVSYEEVALLAHSYWESRNYSHGNAEEDWLRAERELALAR